MGWHWERWASSWNKCGHDGDSELFWEAECAILINMVKSQPRSAAQAQKNILIIGESNWLRWRYIYIYMNESERQQLWEWYVSEYFLTLLKKILLAEKVLITS